MSSTDPDTLTALFTATVCAKDGALIQLNLGLPTKRLKVDIDVSITWN
jgi:hypothetical protein